MPICAYTQATDPTSVGYLDVAGGLRRVRILFNIRGESTKRLSRTRVSSVSKRSVVAAKCYDTREHAHQDLALMVRTVAVDNAVIGVVVKSV